MDISVGNCQDRVNTKKIANICGGQIMKFFLHFDE